MALDPKSPTARTAHVPDTQDIPARTVNPTAFLLQSMAAAAAHVETIKRIDADPTMVRDGDIVIVTSDPLAAQKLIAGLDLSEAERRILANATMFLDGPVFVGMDVGNNDIVLDSLPRALTQSMYEIEMLRKAPDPAPVIQEAKHKRFSRNPFHKEGREGIPKLRRRK